MKSFRIGKNRSDFAAAEADTENKRFYAYGKQI